MRVTELLQCRVQTDARRKHPFLDLLLGVLWPLNGSRPWPEEAAGDEAVVNESDNSQDRFDLSSRAVKGCEWQW